MGYFIIIRGPLGVGKSTISKKLTKILHAEYISMDSILDKYGLAKVDSGYTPKDFIKANIRILPEAKNKLKQGKIVIFDGNFYFKEQIKYLVKKLKNYKFYIFTLKAPLATCIERDKKRKLSYGKKATEAVYNLVSKFDYGNLIETKKKSIDQTIKEIFSYLPK